MKAKEEMMVGGAQEECRPRPSGTKKTLFKSFESVSFNYHVLPYYGPCVAYLVVHLLYYFLYGNILPLFLFAFSFNFPYYKWKKYVPW